MEITEIEKAYSYFLIKALDSDSKSIFRLYNRFHSALNCFNADEKEIKLMLDEQKAEKFLREKKNYRTEEYLNLGKKGINMVLFCDDLYPDRLKNIPDPPFGLFYIGRLPEDDAPAIGVIGARICSEYGKNIASKTGAFLGTKKVNVISGMAKGIDSISQKACVKEGWNTYAVLGCGADICYPTEEKELYNQIKKHGGIISEYAPGTQPTAFHFPQRNRIVSGLSDALIVIEARQKSGTLITVDMALEQGKDVYAVPGRISDELSTGCNRLIKQGAGMFLSPEDFYEDFFNRQLSFKPKIKQVISAITMTDVKTDVDGLKLKNMVGLNETERKVYGLLNETPQALSDIMVMSDIPMTVSEMSTALINLCIKGYVEQVGVGHFHLKM